MQRKDKSLVNCFLSITEQKKLSGRHTFMATLHELTTKIRDTSVATFSVLDAIQKCVVVCDANGVIKFMNRHAEELVGWNEEALGQNVSIMMPSPYAERHTQFIQNYIKAGKPKIIGKGARTVVAQRKDGSLMAVDIAVDEVVLNGVRYFVGVLREMAKDVQEHRSILQDTRGVVNSLTVAAIVIDRNGIIQAFNAGAEAILGYSMVDVLGENVKKLMNDSDASKHDMYIQNYIKTGTAKVIGSTRIVLAKNMDGVLVPVVLSISKTVNPDDPEDFLFTGVLMRSETDDKGNKSAGSTSYTAADRNFKQMNSAGDNTISGCTAIKDFGAAEDANKAARPEMQDTWVMVDEFAETKGFAYFGVYDGHGGTTAADFCMSKLHMFLSKYVKHHADWTIEQMFEKAYRVTHDAMGTEIGKTGTTALSVFLQNGALHVANVGDTRAVLCRGGKAQRLSVDHKASDPTEQKAVESRGGVILNGRVSGILGITRCLGDYRAEKYVSRVPQVTTVQSSKDDIVVLACDGLFDVLSDQETCDLASKCRSTGLPAQKAAKALVEAAMSKHTMDNVTVLVLYL